MGSETKKEIRARILALRRNLSRSEVEERSRKVFDRLRQSGLLSGCEHVALYAAADNEVLTRPIFDFLAAAGARLYLPRLCGRGPEIDFFDVSDWDRLVVSPFGIPEPEPSSQPAVPALFDLILVPGIAFDRTGGRLGYGRGCYDRFLRRRRPHVPAVGIGYDFQLIEQLPLEPHDVRLSGVAVESVLVFPAAQSGN